MAKSSTKQPRTRKRPRFIITIFQSRWPDPESLDDKFLEDFLRLFDQCVTSSLGLIDIDLWLVSSGGSAHVAYRLWLALRARCFQLRIVLPDVAKSAATLLALGSDQIVMGAASVLGPLDVQWAHPDNVEETISGLDIAKYPEYLANFAATHVNSGEAALFFRPLAKKVDGLLTMRIQDELNVASIYAQAMLAGRVHEPPENFCARSVAEHLVRGFPSHDFSICRNQVRNLGLPVLALEDFEERELVEVAYNRWMDSRDRSLRQESLIQIQRADS